MPHIDLRRALDVQSAAVYRDPALEQLLTDGIRVHEQHPELCPIGQCRAAIEAARILAAATGSPS